MRVGIKHSLTHLAVLIDRSAGRGVDAKNVQLAAGIGIHGGFDMREAYVAATRPKPSWHLTLPQDLSKFEFVLAVVLTCTPNLGQAKLESVRVMAHEAMVAGEPFANTIGGLLPIALCGLTFAV